MGALSTGVLMERFMKSFKEHPALTLFCMLLCSSVLVYSVTAFANKDELAELKTETTEKFEKIERRLDNLEFGIASRALETEIFELQRIVEHGTARELDHKRLNKLQNELKRLESR